jgi:hypothetical protein
MQTFQKKSALSKRKVCTKSAESARVLHKVCISTTRLSGENGSLIKMQTWCTLNADLNRHIADMMQTIIKYAVGALFCCHTPSMHKLISLPFFHQQIGVLLFSIILFRNILYTLFAIILYYFSIILIIFLAVSVLLFLIIFSKIMDYYTHYFISIMFIIFYGINYCYYCNYSTIMLIILFFIIHIICNYFILIFYYTNYFSCSFWAIIFLLFFKNNGLLFALFYFYYVHYFLRH